jgi:hypothetical protein
MPMDFDSKITLGARFAKKSQIPDFHWQLIEACWHQEPDKRPQFHDIVDGFHQHHAYNLPGTDLVQVYAYEENVYRKFDLPASADRGEQFWTSENANALIEQFIKAQSWDLQKVSKCW